MEENAEKQEKLSEKFNEFTQNIGVKLAVIVAALLLLQIPLYMVKRLTQNRLEKFEKVQSEIGYSWGKPQLLSLSPNVEFMDISADIKPEIRYRGIYQTVVYNADVKIKAEFINVRENQFADLFVSDIDRISNAVVTVNGKSVNVVRYVNYLKIPLEKGNSVIEMTMNLRGSYDFKVTSSAKKNHIAISGKWGSPSFTGTFLPDRRKIEKDSFAAEWDFGEFTSVAYDIGVNLNLPANTYQQVERCFNYTTLFLIIFFFTVLVADIVTKAKIHILQYLIASGAPVLFYLMALTFGESIGFTAGYIVSAAVIVLMVTMYAKAFIGKLRPALVMGIIFAASYAVNFVLLRMEDLALLSGTIILAIVLAILMALTGKMNRQQ